MVAEHRLPLLSSIVYDDFAHHPTAIRTTLEGLRAKVGAARIVVAMEPRSNSMRLGAHADALAPSLELADAVVFLHRPGLAWDAGKVVAAVERALNEIRLKNERHQLAEQLAESNRQLERRVRELTTLYGIGKSFFWPTSIGFDDSTSPARLSPLIRRSARPLRLPFQA